MNQSIRIPLQIGTGAFGYSTGAVVGGAFTLAIGASAARRALGGTFDVSTILLVASALSMLAYTVSAIRTARRMRASDLGVSAAGVSIAGGPRGGRTHAWSDLTAPFATVTRTEERRVELAWILVGLPLSFLAGLFASSVVGSSSSNIQIVRTVVVTRLALRLRSGEALVIAETDDPEEAASLEAARDTIASVGEGKRVVEGAPFHPVRIIVCPQCGAPVVPAEAPAVQCAHCSTVVPLADDARRLAASARETAAARAESHRLVGDLLAQPDASRVDGTLRLLSIAQIAAWPIGWTAVAWRGRASGWASVELLYVLAPGLAVLALYFLAIGAASERRALRALTLGFGALAPLRPGDAARCRRCHAPLAAAAGVASCAYCSADNVVGIDLRAAVDAARNEQPTFEEVLAKRRETRVSGIGLKIVAAIFLLFWIAVTIGHVTG